VRIVRHARADERAALGPASMKSGSSPTPKPASTNAFTVATLLATAYDCESSGTRFGSPWPGSISTIGKRRRSRSFFTRRSSAKRSRSP